MTEIAHFFWEGEMTLIEKSCIKSYIDNGFNVKIWSYNNITIDGAESCDANNIFDYNLKDIIKQNFFGITNNIPALSDCIRYKILCLHGGWWFDTDCFCLKNESEYKKLILDNDLVSFYENDTEIYVASGSFYLKKYSETSKKLLFEINNLIDKYKGINVPWGTYGPLFFTDFITRNGLKGGILNYSLAYSISFYNFELYFNQDKVEEGLSLIKNSYFTHIWNTQFKLLDIDKNNIIDGTLIYNLFNN